MSKILVDTNLLLDDANILYKLVDCCEVIVLSSVVLKELDKHKVDPDLMYSARNAIRAIKEFSKEFPENIEFVVNELDISSNDSKIIEDAVKSGAKIATKDIAMSIIASSRNVECDLYGNVANGVFNPYLEISVNVFCDICSYGQKYVDIEYAGIMNIIEDRYEFSRKSWFFVMVQDTLNEDIVAVYANNPKDCVFERIDNLKSYREIISKEDVTFTFKARDVYQICGIYALTHADNVVITGKWGSGKSLLSAAYALANNPKKSFISRPPIGIDNRYNIGFLPGSVTDKLSSWAMGFLSSLYFLCGNTKLQSKDGKSFDYVKDELFKDVFELIDANSLQGLSLLDDYLLLDEAQYCTIDLMSMVLSRATDRSKLILTGDLKQSYALKPSNSGLLKLLRALPHKSMAYVDLKVVYRGEVLELADKLQDKTL